MDVLEDPVQCASLVPIDVGTEFDYFAPTGDSEPDLPGRGDVTDRGDDLVDPVGGNIAIVHGDGVLLGLDQHARHVAEAVGERAGGVMQYRYRGESVRVLVVLPLRPPRQLEAVAARVPDLRHADPCLHIREVASTDHGHRAFACQPGQLGGHTVDQNGRRRIGHDIREGAVEVEKHSGPADTEEGGEFVPRRQRVRNLGQPEIACADLDLGGVGDDDVCSTSTQPVGATVGSDPDDESEAATAGRGCRCS